MDIEAKDRARFWKRVHVRGDGVCWPWRLRGDKDGYGSFKLRGKTRRAHRIAFVLHYGYEPGSLLVCHRCDNPPCCNPAHLFLGTIDDNNQDSIRKGRRRYARGSALPHAKLTEVTAKRIVMLYRSGGYTQSQLAAMFGIVPSGVSALVRGVAWRHVNAPRRRYDERRACAGIANGSAHLDEATVLAIRAAYRTESGNVVAERFGLSDGHVRAIATGRAWAHVKDGIVHKRLTPDNVRTIRRDAAAGIRTAELAKRYNVTTGSIRHIVRRFTWRDLE